MTNASYTCLQALLRGRPFKHKALDHQERPAMKADTKTLRTPSQLADAQFVSRDRLAALDEVAARYAVAITPAIAELIDASDPHDPIAQQFVPDMRELDLHLEESRDPIGDDAHSPVEGMVRRYPDR